MCSFLFFCTSFLGTPLTLPHRGSNDVGNGDSFPPPEPNNSSLNIQDQPTPYAPPGEIIKSPYSSVGLNGYPVPLSTTTPNPQGILTLKLWIPMVSRSYNRQAAVSYVDQRAHGKNPNFPNYGTGEKCNDCTNFLSQMLYAGGHSVIAIYGNTYWDWWFYCDEFNVCTNSNTWSATDWMETYASQYPDKFGPSPNGWPTGLSVGDFFLLDLPSSPLYGIPNHARLVVGWGFPVEGDQTTTWTLLASQHCTDRSRVRWDYNLGPGTRYWSWHVLH